MPWSCEPYLDRNTCSNTQKSSKLPLLNKCIWAVLTTKLFFPTEQVSSALKANTHVHPYLPWKPQHENKQWGSPLWEQFTSRIQADKGCPQVATHFLSLKINKNHYHYLFRFVKKCFFNFVHTGVGFDSQEIIVVHSFSAVRRQMTHNHTCAQTCSKQSVSPPSLRCSQELWFKSTHTPECRALRNQTQSTLAVPQTALTEPQLSLQLHDG